MKVLLDTNTCFAYLTRRSSKVEEHLRSDTRAPPRRLSILIATRAPALIGLLFAAGCEKACVTTMTGPSRAPSADAAAMALPRDEPLSLTAADIPSERVRGAFLAWSAARAGSRQNSTRVRHALVFVDSDTGSTHRIVVREMARSVETCAATLHLLLVTRDSQDAGMPAVREKLLGQDCCAEGPCTERSPVAWVVHLQALLVKGDEEGLEALVDPAEGVRIVTACRGDGCMEEGETTELLQRDKVTVKEVSKTALVDLEGDEVECGKEEAGQFRCSAHGGGYEGHFDWKRAGQGVFLKEVRAAGH